MSRRATRTEPTAAAGGDARPRTIRLAYVKVTDEASRPAASHEIVGFRLREQRRRLGLTLETVASRAGITKSHLSEIERDRATPSVGTLIRLREALSLSLSTIFRSTSPRVVRADERTPIELGGTGIRYSMLSGRDCHRAILIHSDFAPLAHSGEDMHSLPADEEIIHVVTGTLRVMLDGETIDLAGGDSLTFDPRLPHRFENPSDQVPTVTICVIAPLPGDEQIDN